MIFSKTVEHFLAVAAHSNFREAARRLGVTDAALNISVKKLEEQFKIKLFDRTNKGSVLTEHGKIIFEVLQKEGNKLQKSIQNSLAEQMQVPIRFGCVVHIANQYIIPHLPSLEREFGNIQMLFGFSKTILESIENHSLDVGVITWTTVPKNGVRLRKDPQAIVGLKKKYDHIKKVKHVRELAEENWIWHRKPQKNWLDYVGSSTSRVAVCDGPTSLRHLLLSGWGVGLVQLDLLEKGDLKNLVQAPVTFPQEANVYLLTQDVQTERFQRFSNRITELVGK